MPNLTSFESHGYTSDKVSNVFTSYTRSKSVHQSPVELFIQFKMNTTRSGPMRVAITTTIIGTKSPDTASCSLDTMICYMYICKTCYLYEMLTIMINKKNYRRISIRITHIKRSSTLF